MVLRSMCNGGDQHGRDMTRLGGSWQWWVGSNGVWVGFGFQWGCLIFCY